jgi:hypothetical protein
MQSGPPTSAMWAMCRSKSSSVGSRLSLMQGIERLEPDDASAPGHAADERVGEVAGMGTKGAGLGMRCDNGVRTYREHSLRALVRKMGHIDDNAEPIALLHDLGAEVGETARASFAHAIANFIAHVVGQAEAAQPKPVEIVQIRDFLLERRSTFKANDEGNLSPALGADNVRGCLRKNEMVRLFQLCVGVIEGAHETLQIAGREPDRWKVSVGRIPADVITNDRHPARAQGGEMAAVQHPALSALAPPIHVGGDDVAVTDDDDGLFVQLGCWLGHERLTFASALLVASYCRLRR